VSGCRVLVLVDCILDWNWWPQLSCSVCCIFDQFDKL